MNSDLKLKADLLESCLRIRMVEQRIADLYHTDLFQSPVHLSIGQEAVAVGVCAALNGEGLLFINYRGHAYYLARGGDLNSFFAELAGRQTGISKGKAGSMHLACPELGVIGASAVVGSSISNAVGAALAEKIKGKYRPIVTIFGDGATEQGSYHESLNFASLHALPVLFVCEDNNLAVHSYRNSRQSYQLETFASSYGIEVMTVNDGYDPAVVNNGIADALNYMAVNRKPIHVTIKTARYLEHVGVAEDFEAGYRSKSDLSDWMKKDEIFKSEMNRALVDKISNEIDIAVNFAIASPYSLASELMKDVY